MAQKSLLLLTLMVVAIISGCASSPTRGQVVRAATIGQKTQEPVSAPATTVTYTPIGCKGGPKYFNSAKDCETAMQSGECSYYTPSYTGGRWKNPVDGKRLFLIPVEEPVCVKTQTVKGVSWVAQPPNTEFRFTKEADGSFSKVPYALHACGNRVMDIIYPEPKKVVASSPTPPPKQTRNVCTENGLYGDQYFPGVQDGEPVCFEKLPWYAWENLKTPVYVTAGVVIVAVAVYCIVTGRCSLHGRREAGSSSSGGGGGGGGAQGGLPTSGPVGSPPVP